MKNGGDPMDLPKRKQIRLPDYDYSSPGAYFVTICARDRRCILSYVAVGADTLGGPILNLRAAGKVTDKYILSISRTPGAQVDKYVIMPNHVHLLLRISENDAGTDSGPPRASAPTIPNVVGTMKRLINRELGENIWQRGYYEHVIRNEDDYREIWQYIETNPAKWAEDRYFGE